MTPKERPSFWNQPITRREILKVTVSTAGLGTAIYLAGDFIASQEEEDAQYSLSERITDGLEFMKTQGLTPAQDVLYGFTYPSTKEVAQQYLNALIPWYLNPDRKPWLVVIEEGNTSYFFRRVRRFIGWDKNITEEADGTVIRATNEEEIDLLYLNPSFQKANHTERAVTLYHEGLHLFYQPPDLDDFLASESMPNIGQILLSRLYIENGFLIRGVNRQLWAAYDQAVQQKNPQIWEQALKDAYKVN
ncbi:hypothetical protein HYS96_03615 [Candidatus Daviesbacteria bacterium]|nr:hypothetical protein [Candidatus Daviesbacteria bacterium]